MRAARQEAVDIPQPAGTVFQAVLGVVQNNKSAQILAVHSTGRKLVVREKAKLSNAKLQQIFVEDQGNAARVHIVVGSDPRTQKALLDGKQNAKSLAKLIENVQGALDGSAPAPATPVADHFLQNKTEVPWTDPNEDPQIELGGNLRAAFGL